MEDGRRTANTANLATTTPVFVVLLKYCNSIQPSSGGSKHHLFGPSQFLIVRGPVVVAPSTAWLLDHDEDRLKPMEPSALRMSNGWQDTGSRKLQPSGNGCNGDAALVLVE